MSKRDAITAWVDLGAGQAQSFKVEARKGGRRVRQRRAGSYTFLEELSGRRIDTAHVVHAVKFQSARLVAVDEQIADEAPVVRKPKVAKVGTLGLELVQ